MSLLYPSLLWHLIPLLCDKHSNCSVFSSNWHPLRYRLFPAVQDLICSRPWSRPLTIHPLFHTHLHNSNSHVSCKHARGWRRRREPPPPTTAPTPVYAVLISQVGFRAALSSLITAASLSRPGLFNWPSETRGNTAISIKLTTHIVFSMSTN